MNVFALHLDVKGLGGIENKNAGPTRRPPIRQGQTYRATNVCCNNMRSNRSIPIGIREKDVRIHIALKQTFRFCMRYGKYLRHAHVMQTKLCMGGTNIENEKTKLLNHIGVFTIVLTKYDWFWKKRQSNYYFFPLDHL